jgi:hypothetical protein
MKDKARRGAALAMAIIFTLMTLFLVAGIIRRLGALSAQMTPQPGTAQGKAQGMAQAMAGLGYAFALLQTGVPPNSSYSCGAALSAWFPRQPTVALGFQQQDDAGHWAVTVQTQAVSSLPACPSSFGS